MEMTIIPNGGIYQGMRMHSTCSFDCTLQALYFLYNFTAPGRQFLDRRIQSDKLYGGVGIHVEKILNLVSKNAFGSAKAIWVTEVFGKEMYDDLDLWEEEIEQGLRTEGMVPNS